MTYNQGFRVEFKERGLPANIRSDDLRFRTRLVQFEQARRLVSTTGHRHRTHPYTGLPDIDYPLHDKTIVVTRCGRICLGKKKINFSQVFAGELYGL
jgi:hypothetical protein